MIGTVEWSEELGLGAPAIGQVYGFRQLPTREFRYVGQTTKPIHLRTSQHLQMAHSGRKTPFYDWLRKQEADDYQVVSLESVLTSREDLGEAETAWITVLRVAGDRLLNLSDGGLGPSGVTWTEERREYMRRINLGRKGISRPGRENPMWGRKHSYEQRMRWSIERRGSISGEKNPNYGKFREAHPSFHRAVSPETRIVLSNQKKGKLNPNFGKETSVETRTKMSAAQKGRPKPSSVRSAHTRHHTNKGVYNEKCQHCLDDKTIASRGE